MKTFIADFKNPEHGKDILYLLNEYAKDPLGGSEPISDFARDNLLGALAEIPGAFSVLCYIGSTPAGLANCFQGFSTFKCKPLINIHDIVVIEEYRGRGISQAIMETIESVAIQRQCCKLTLEVLEGNQNAISAYKKFGFIPYELDNKYGRASFWEKELETDK
jgi:ribosomal protein S18 acetylase RimI-like enzyme